MKHLHTFAALGCTGLALVWQGGTSPWAPAAATETQAVALQFQATVGQEAFSCEQSYRLGTSASQVTPLDFRFYVSDVALIDANGNAVPLTLAQDGRWQYETVALLDFEDKSGGCANGTVEMNNRIVGTVPPGDYVGLQFTLGVPFELNHADSTLAASPLNLTSLWWNWQAGYKFARIDLSSHSLTGRLPSQTGEHSVKHSVKHGDRHHSPHGSGQGSPQPAHGDDHDSSQAFFIHLGSTGCELAEGAQSPTHCSHPNRSTITFAEFDPTQNVIVADLAALVANTNLTANQPNTAPGCMSAPDDSDCTGIMAALGIPFDGAHHGTHHGTQNPPQTFFRME